MQLHPAVSQTGSACLQGPSARERKRDSNAFESARADYSKIHISAKAAVGASGDHRTEQWLG